MITRRAVLTGALGLAVAGCGVAGYPGPARAVTIGAGEPGGFYLAFAELLAGRLSDSEPPLRGSAVATEGSVDNLQRLAARRVDLALVLADVAQAAGQGNPPFGAAVSMRALGRVYENYMQLVVLAGSPVRGLADLSGRTVALGAPSSGAAVFGQRMLAAAGLTASVRNLLLGDAIAALEAGRVDALLWSGGVPTPSLADLDRRVGIRLLPLDGVLPALRSSFGGVYEQAPVPSGAYRQVRELPTIGVANLLVCAPDLPDDVAAAVVRVLVRRAGDLVPREALGTQFLDVRSLIGTLGVPLHPGAAAAYRDLHG